MRVAILSHFQKFAPSYALAVGWYERAKMMEYFGVDFTFFTAKNCPPGCFPHQESVLKTIPGSRPFEFKVEEFTQQYLELLHDFDVVLTADMIYQRKGNFLAWNQAARNCTRLIKPWWLHWIHSSWSIRPGNLNLKDPDSLRYQMMDRSFLVYLNEAESGQLVQMYDTDPDHVRFVHNPKDPRVFYNMHPYSWEIIKRLRLYEKDVVCVFPHCSTRMEAKGIDAVLRVIAGLKEAGLSVGLVFCNANARKVQAEIEEKRGHAALMQLEEGTDYMFTHDLDNFADMPRQVVRDLMQISNIFVFGSWRETTGNVFQEAQISNNLLVLNENLPCLKELARKDKVVWLKNTYKTPGRRDGQTGDLQNVAYVPDEKKYFTQLAQVQIIPKLDSKRYMWAFGFERIWHTQMEPLLMEAAELANTIDPPDMAKAYTEETTAPEHTYAAGGGDPC